MGQINKKWHEAHPMPKGASLAQRIKWHQQHQKNCACRPIPKTVQAAMRDEAPRKKA